MMAKKDDKKVEIPGNDNVDTRQNESLNQVNDIQVQASSLDEKITQVQAQIEAEQDEDVKQTLQIKLNALLEAKEEINSILVSANDALQSVQAKAQMTANAQKKTDMTGISVKKTDKPVISGANIKLTEKGYVVSPRKQKGV